MGAEPSKPQPGATFQVIGAGLSRTGTSSFNMALSILLNGPAYHGGTQVVLGPASVIPSWLSLFSHWPASTKDDTAAIQRIIRSQLDGYVGATDVPANGLVTELLTAYPNAVVICTLRDPEPWARSMNVIASATTMWFLRFVLFLLPGKRRFPDFIDAQIRMWHHHYGDGPAIDAYDKHIAYLKSVVPEDRLFFVDVKDGWAPLCRALGKEVPDVPFPHVNDAKATEELAQKMVMKGLQRWAFVLGAVAVGGFGVWYRR